MRGDELGKLHNIFIRYNFTRLVDRVQGDTLKTNAKSRVEKKKSVVNTWVRQRRAD